MVKVVNSAEPPEEKKGSGSPVAGTRLETTARLRNACATMLVVSPKAR